MVDGGGVQRGLIGRRGRALSKDDLINFYISKKSDEEKCTRASFPGALSPERARTSERGASSPAARHRIQANVASDAARCRPSTKTSRRPPRSWSPFSTTTCGLGSTSSSSCRCAPTPRRLCPRGPRDRLHPRDASLARALARRADVPSNARAMSLFPRGRFSRPSAFFFRPAHN